MFRTKILPSALVATLVLGAAGLAFAGSDDGEHGREMAAALAARISPAQAIAAAEQRSGGHAVKIDLDHEHGAYVYDVKTVSKDKVARILVDPDSGKVLGSREKGLFDRIFDDEDHGEFAKLAASPTTLAAAIATAQQQVGGKAIEARFDNEDDVLRIKVEVAKDNAVHKVMIDGASGKVLAGRAGDHGDHDEH